jgi:hypothetical protein
MNICLGNIQFSEIEKTLGYKLTDEDKIIWDKYHIDNADLSGKDSGFHIFDIPRCIRYKGEEAKNAILKMFTPEKITNPIGKFQVYEQK